MIKLPPALNWCLGDCSVDDEPSPKSHANSVASVDVLVKVIVAGAFLIVPSKLKFATGGVFLQAAARVNNAIKIAHVFVF